MDADTVPPWPLPTGHRYGFAGYDLRNHDGRSSISHFEGLRAWRLAYRDRIKRIDLPTTAFDAVTQKAVLHVQELAKLPKTGVIDLSTWDAVFTIEKPVVAPPAEPKPPDRRGLRLKAKKTRDYWRRVSSRVEFTTDGSQPPWWPGRPFGPGEFGWHVEQLQRLLQARETGTFTKELGARVRAARRLHGLPVSNVVDLRLAVALDPGPWASPATGPGTP
jgi:hypothetical protein